MKEALIASLVDLFQNGPKDRALGICHHVRECGAGMLVECLFYSWPHFSGDIDFPVPGGQEAFNEYDDNWAGAYGAKRWALAEYMLRELVQ